MDKRYTKADVKHPSEKRAFLSNDEESNNSPFSSKSKNKYESSKPNYSHKNYYKVATDEKKSEKKTHPSWE